ncbi:hypothetical protein WN944_006226 [Citrus x changshan-huyou]|uniref:Retrotransposon gag domain-containing protein n=1 Tax=Citrus x changshan-huyou TaxID=2935761 RepID=A0AAP0MLA5_9ROSI
MDRFEGFVSNVARREAELCTGTQNTIEHAHDLGATTFKGTTDLVSSKSWLIRLRGIVDVMRCTNEERLSSIEFLLEGNVYHWWMSVLRRYGGRGAVTWANFQREFTDKFFPFVYQEDRINEFMTLVQGSMTVKEYEQCIGFGTLVRVATRIERSRREAQRAEPQQHKQGPAWPVSGPISRTQKREVEHRDFSTSQQYNQRPEFLGGKRPSSHDSIQQSSNGIMFEWFGILFPVMTTGTLEEGLSKLDIKQQFCARSQSNAGETSGSRQRSQSSRPHTQARVFALTQHEAHATPNVVTVATPVGNSLSAESVFQDCAVKLGNKDMVPDLILLDINDFNAILGMEWLANYCTTVDCFWKEVTFRKSGESDIIFYREQRILHSSVISAISAKRLLRKYCFAYLAHVIDSRVSNVKLEDIPVVKEFLDVFPDDLPSLPPDRDVEFTIDLVPGTTPISMAP